MPARPARWALKLKVCNTHRRRINQSERTAKYTHVYQTQQAISRSSQACYLPNGTGKNVRVLVFAQGDAAKAAQEAGAEFVGFEDLIKKVQEGFVDFDTAIATPDAMTEVRKVARVLGPRGLMPNPKTGTVTDDTAKAVKEVKAGRVDYKVDKNANISAAVGKLSFSNEGITENIVALIDSVVKARPASAKGAYIESVTVSCAMCPGLPVDTASIAKL